jgi:hypothetical protein
MPQLPARHGRRDETSAARPGAAGSRARAAAPLEENERLFGIPLDFLLTVDGRQQQPERVYRKIQPVERVALRPEEAWVKREA